MGGGKRVPTSAAYRGTPQGYPGRKGEVFPDSNVGERFRLNRRSVWRVPIGAEWRAVAPSAAKARDSHERYAFCARNGGQKPAGRPENPPVGASTFYLWRG